MEETMKRKRGRPPAANDSTGLPIMTSRWPRLSIRVEPKTKMTLSAITAETGQSLWEVLGAAVASYLDSMKPEARKAIAARMVEAVRETGSGE